MIKNKTVTFTPDEIDAIEAVCKIDCSEINCSDCPFDYGSNCRLSDVKDDLYELLHLAGVTTPVY